jgi:hypothetical protein
MTRRIPRRQGVLCMYDLRRFGARVLIDAVRAHSLVLVGGHAIENPHCLTPDEFLELDAGSATDLSEADLAA